MWDINSINEESRVDLKECPVLWRCCWRFHSLMPKGRLRVGNSLWKSHVRVENDSPLDVVSHPNQQILGHCSHGLKVNTGKTELIAVPVKIVATWSRPLFGSARTRCARAPLWGILASTLTSTSRGTRTYRPSSKKMQWYPHWTVSRGSSNPCVTFTYDSRRPGPLARPIPSGSIWKRVREQHTARPESAQFLSARSLWPTEIRPYIERAGGTLLAHRPSAVTSVTQPSPKKLAEPGNHRLSLPSFQWTPNSTPETPSRTLIWPSRTWEPALASVAFYIASYSSTTICP